MDLLSLRTFKAVAETGAISRAAEQLCCVQSAVTTRLQALEAELGATLVYRGRGSRVATLTPTGLTLLDYAERILRLADEAKRLIKETGGEPVAIRVGSMETTAAIRLPPILSQFSRRLPKVGLSLRTGPTADLMLEVLAHRLDCAFVCGPVEHPDLVVKPAYSEELVLVGSIDADPESADVLLAFRPGCSYRARTEEWLRHSGRPSARLMELGTLDGIFGCVASGMGATVMPRAVVETSRFRETLQIRALPPEYGMAETLLVRHRDALFTGTMRAFYDMVHGASDIAVKALA